MKFSSNWLSEAGQTYKVPMLLLNKFSMKNEPHRTKPQHAVPSKPLFNCYHSSSQCSSSHSSLQQVMMSNLNLVWSLHARGLAGFRASCSKIIHLKIVFMVMLVEPAQRETLCSGPSHCCRQVHVYCEWKSEKIYSFLGFSRYRNDLTSGAGNICISTMPEHRPQLNVFSVHWSGKAGAPKP